MLRPPDGCIPYLERDNISLFNNIHIKSLVDNASFSANSLMLACISGTMCQLLNDINVEETVILSEFTLEELQPLQAYLLGDLYPLAKGSSHEREEVFKSFGIHRPLKEPNHSIGIKLLDPDFGSENDFEPSEPNSRKRRVSTTKYHESSPSEDENEGKYVFQDVPKQVWGYVRYPSDLPISQGKNREKTLQKLEDYGRKHKDYVQIGTCPELNKEQLLNYDLPAPIETYLKSPSSSSQMSERMMPKGQGPFKCSMCSARCKTKTAVDKHTFKYHTEKYSCPHCTKDFAQSHWPDFVKHMFEHTLGSDPLVHSCISCGYSTDVLSRIDQHRISHGKYHNNECPYEDCKEEKFWSHLDYQIHVNKVHQGKWLFRCGHCSQTFEDKSEVSKHINTLHRQTKKKQKDIVCDICGKSFTNETHLRTHLGSRRCKIVDFPLLQCQSCPFQTKNQAYLNKHIRTVHERSPCPICGKLVPKTRLKTHMTIFHTEEHAKPFQCKICGKGFATRLAFQEHTNTHTGEKPYQCDRCEKRFASSGNMYMHRRSSHYGYKRSK